MEQRGFAYQRYTYGFGYVWICGIDDGRLPYGRYHGVWDVGGERDQYVGIKFNIRDDESSVVSGLGIDPNYLHNNGGDRGDGDRLAWGRYRDLEQQCGDDKRHSSGYGDV